MSPVAVESPTVDPFTSLKGSLRSVPAFNPPASTVESMASTSNGTSWRPPNPVTGWRATAVEHPPARTADNFAFDSMEDALAAFARGEFLVVMDDENRENEGDLILAASECSTEKLAWMIRHTRCG